MRRFVFLSFAFIAAFVCHAASVSTNAIPAVASNLSAIRTAAAKSPCRQCEAITRSGNRCKRNAMLGATRCRQHQKILDRRTGHAPNATKTRQKGG